MLLYSHDPGFSFEDWKHEPIAKLFGGRDCVMAITEDGRVLQKVCNRDCAARTEYWRNITSIAISGCIPGAAIGLVNDGTCMIAKKPLKRILGQTGMHRVNDAIKQWTDIVAVYANDAFFGLDRNGRVHYVCFSESAYDYRETENWPDVVALFPGSQNALFGVTEDGRVVCAGHSCTAGPCGDLRPKLSELSDIAAVCPAGSEGEQLLLFRKDGTVTDIRGNAYPNAALPVTADHCFVLCAYRNTQDAITMVPYGMPPSALSCRGGKLGHFAIGFRDAQAFVIAVKDTSGLLGRLFG